MAGLTELRNAAMERAMGRCEWPACDDGQDLQLAHNLHRGMGGNPAGDRNTIDNVAILCRYHHDVQDGRTVAYRRRAVSDLLWAFIAERDRITGVVA